MNLNDLLIDITDTQIDVGAQGLCLNAANIQTGDVFVALKGQSTHGIDYIDQAIENGCIAVLVDSQDFDCSVPSVRIDNLRQHLPVLASTYYSEAAQVEVIGVTGTNGKTSVSYFISQLLNQLGVKNGLIGTLGVTHSTAVSNNTTPDILTLYKILHQYHLDGIHMAVLEVSSHGLDQNRVAGINFKQAVFTNLTQDHLDYHQNLDKYKDAKLKLFTLNSLESVVINHDDIQHEDFLAVSKHATQTTYGLDDFGKINATTEGFLCQLDGFVFESPLLGKFNLSNILAALNSVEQLGFERSSIIPLLHHLFPPTGRMHRIKNTLAWVDYAHTPDAIENAINTLQSHYPDH
ncbi:MAG: UDP-N-acetylmuramoyl-L-alanyl-D-glutamate--2,6-diaminopimelate ligase, partial [Candidatus Thioglobus sp.]